MNKWIDEYMNKWINSLSQRINGWIDTQNLYNFTYMHPSDVHPNIGKYALYWFTRMTAVVLEKGGYPPMPRSQALRPL